MILNKQINNIYIYFDAYLCIVLYARIKTCANLDTYIRICEKLFRNIFEKILLQFENVTEKF